MTSKPRFLAPKARKGDGLGYVNDPRLGMKDEPEVVGPAIVEPYSESALFWKSLRHAAEVEAAQELRKDLTPEQRLLDAQRRAKAKHVNVKGDLTAVESDLRRARAGGRTNLTKIVRRLERVEARLDGEVSV